MEENQAMESTNEDSGEDFYEMIEAPKFVDFTVSDHYIPNDRYWFCSRVGCEEKHPEEMDSEVVDKNFRMRVMAARSPNVRLQRAPRNLKCPLTAPPKSRVARLALISSISKRIVDATVKSRPPIPKLITTPNSKTKQAHVKAVTTPRNRKLNSNINAFLSVKNPKTISAEVPKTTMVAKALVFQSPKKDAKKITSTETNIPVKTIRSAMTKLEITGGKKNVLGDGQPLPRDASRKKFRGRVVKSRVFDSLGAHNCKHQDAKSARVLKRRSKEKNSRLPLPDHVAQDICNEDASYMDDKSKHVSMQGCSLASSAKSNEGNQDELSRSEDSENLSKDSNETSISNSEERISEKSEEGQKHQENNHEEIAKTGALEINSDDKENVASVNKDTAVASVDDIEHESECTTDENIAPNENRGNNSYNQSERVPFGKLEKSKTTAKVKGVLKKTLKENSTTSAAVGGFHGIQSSRPKSTNPKPFRLRTDERVVLREANLGKKLNCPLKDITASRRFHGEKLQRKNQISNQNFECDNHVEEEYEKRMTGRKTPDDDRQGGTGPDSSNLIGDSMDSKKCVALEHQKQSLCRRFEPGKERATKKADDNLKRTKLENIQQKVGKPRRDLASKEEKTSLVPPSRQLIARKETSKDAKRPSNASSRKRRPATIPKEPNFHGSGVYQGTRKLA